jgi:hypothetical protein
MGHSDALKGIVGGLAASAVAVCRVSWIYDRNVEWIFIIL